MASTTTAPVVATTLSVPGAQGVQEAGEVRETRLHGLGAEALEQLGRELDAIRESVVQSRGGRDAAYIRRVIAVERHLRVGSRLLLVVAGRNKAAWVLGTTGL